MGTRLKLLICDKCGVAGYDHRRIGLLVDGHLVTEVTLCRPDAVDRIKDTSNVIEYGYQTPFGS